MHMFFLLYLVFFKHLFRDPNHVFISRVCVPTCSVADIEKIVKSLPILRRTYRMGCATPGADTPPMNRHLRKRDESCCLRVGRRLLFKGRAWRVLCLGCFIWCFICMGCLRGVLFVGYFLFMLWAVCIGCGVLWGCMCCACAMLCVWRSFMSYIEECRGELVFN